MIAQDTIRQIQSRIDIVDIVGSFVKLRRRGANYLGLCPFHNEKTPSFTVSPSKEFYKCFGCGRSGNAIGFLMEHEKYSFVEAIHWLAQKYGIEIEETVQSPEQIAQRQIADSLYIINTFAQQYFTETLFDTEEGRDVGLSYFRERGFREDIIRKFQLGYCLDTRDAFSATALKKGYNADYLRKSGLMVMRGERPADNYRGRVIFPIHSPGGKIVGFGARILKKNDRAPKYINTPENEIYVKSQTLYGLHFARHAIDREDECLLVEGYTDVISLHQAGLEHAVASSGTSLTQDQLRLIRKYTGNLTILYDGDPAGIKAAMRGLDMALEEGLHVQLVLLPDKEDPDSYVRKVGQNAFRQFIRANSKDFIFFKLQVALGDLQGDPRKKSALVNDIAGSISRINKAEDFTRQQEYIRQCSQILEIDEQGLTTLVNKHIREHLQKKSHVQQGKPPVPDTPAPDPEGADEIQEDVEFLMDQELQEKNLVRVLLEYGTREWNEQTRIADYIFHSPINFNLIRNETIRDILSQYKSILESGQVPDSKDFLYHSDPEVSKLAVNVVFTPYEVSENWKKQYRIEVPDREALFREDADSVINYLLQKMILRLVNENLQELKAATDMVEMEKLMKVNNQLVDLKKEIYARTGTVVRK